MVGREVAKGRDVLGRVEELLGDDPELALHRGRHFFHLTSDVLGVGLGENRCHRGGDHGLLRARVLHEHVMDEVNSTTLPVGSGKDLGDRGL